MLVPIHPENLEPLRAQLDSAGIPFVPLVAAGGVFLVGVLMIGAYMQRGRAATSEPTLLDAIDEDPELAPTIPRKKRSPQS